MSEKTNIESIRELLFDEKQTVETIFNDYVVPEFTTKELIEKILFSIDDITKITKNPIIKLRFVHYQILVLFLLAQSCGQEDPISGDIYQKILIYLQMVMPIAASLSETSAQEFLSAIEEMVSSQFPETIQKLENDIGYSTKEESDDNHPPPITEPVDGSAAKEDGKPKRKYYGNAIHTRKEKVEAPLRVGGNYTSLRHSISKDHIEQPKMIRIRFKKPHSHEKKKPR